MVTYTPLVDVEALVTRVRDQVKRDDKRWFERAACLGSPASPDVYFPDDESEPPPPDALARCATCPVAASCLADALRHEANAGMRFGWWGGYSPDEREALAACVLIPEAEQVPDPSSPAEIARSLRARNQTVAHIASELGCTERTVYRYLSSAA